MTARVSALAVVVICTVFAVVGPAAPGPYVFEDHRLSVVAVARMKAGDGYYRAMDTAMREVGVGPVAEPRSFRLPTLFLLWRWIPGAPPGSLWIPFVVMVAAAALLLVAYTNAPLVVPLVVVYLIGVGREQFNGIYLMLEFWVAPFTAASLLFTRRRWRGDAAFALAATLVRELAAGLLVGGLLAALRHRRPWRPWAIATVAGVVGALVHWHFAGRYLVAHGHESPLLGTARFPKSLIDGLTFELPGPPALWLAAWAAALWNLARRRELLGVAPLFALPLAGIWIHRPYWGLITVPFVLVWAAEAVVAVLPDRLRVRAT